MGSSPTKGNFSGSLRVKQLSDKQKITGSSPVQSIFYKIFFSVSLMVEQLSSEQ